MLEHQAVSLVRKGYHVILTGDMNISHRRIDNCDPDEDFDDSPARIWLTKLLNPENGKFHKKNLLGVQNGLPQNIFRILNLAKLSDVYFVDVFRRLHPNAKEQYTCWNSQKSARVTNFGTRIDYIICDSELLQYFNSCDIHPDVMGSDHCPVSAVLDIDLISNDKLIKRCTKNWPEFSGKQISLSSFLVKKSSSADEVKEPTAKKRTASAANGQATLSTFFKKRTKVDVEEKSEHPASASPKVIDIEPVRKPKQMNSDWKNILRGPPPAPMCSGHGELSVLRTVKKDGPTKGKRFYCCARPEGQTGNKEARCSFFVWI